MSLIDALGWVACAITVMYTTVGLLAQIRSNYNSKSAVGLALPMIAMMFATFFSWIIYGVLKDDYFIAIPNGLGAVFSFILLYQMWAYHYRYPRKYR